jgi:dephospho-CoA kinase
MGGLRVGLTGGLACGKSHVARLLESYGAHVIHADELGHQTLLPDGEAYEPVIELFGRDIVMPDGLIDRHRLAGMVFGNPQKLAQLNAIVHPAVHRLEHAISKRILAADPEAIVVYEAAILIEAGTYKHFDKLILVTCEEGQQIARAMARDSATREEVLARIQRQLPLTDKRKYADYVIDTSGTREDTARQTRVVYDALRAL